MSSMLNDQDASMRWAHSAHSFDRMTFTSMVNDISKFSASKKSARPQAAEASSHQSPSVINVGESIPEQTKTPPARTPTRGKQTFKPSPVLHAFARQQSIERVKTAPAGPSPRRQSRQPRPAIERLGVSTKPATQVHSMSFDNKTGNSSVTDWRNKHAKTTYIRDYAKGPDQAMRARVSPPRTRARLVRDDEKPMPSLEPATFKFTSAPEAEPDELVLFPDNRTTMRSAYQRPPPPTMSEQEKAVMNSFKERLLHKAPPFFENSAAWSKFYVQTEYQQSMNSTGMRITKQAAAKPGPKLTEAAKQVFKAEAVADVQEYYEGLPPAQQRVFNSLVTEIARS
ncbi:hypothetical protein J8273_2326 [Carpediemonas membranifera]|uniref:Uncharacterized protein n=1 Tax=Carpediemonas membranifera TaxID=201153 RepID=A0A8J6E5M3_9EUKA|nr:hypothetical protein J8273_2326 [Carpediemonas membranifera]|eukprot:KAG9395977.1 hypothetical protein J8273_2326 [Carpediemonas membranifera]